MDFRSYITEVFNKPYKWRWGGRNDEYWEAVFKNDKGHTFAVYFYNVKHMYTEDEYPKGTWSFEFTINTDWDSDDYFDDEYGVTGTGDQFKIFATVSSILMAFLKLHKFDDEFEGIFFSAKEKSRAKLYVRFAKMIQKKTYLKKMKIKKMSGYLMTYFLTRKKYEDYELI